MKIIAELVFVVEERDRQQDLRRAYTDQHMSWLSI